MNKLTQYAGLLSACGLVILAVLVLLDIIGRNFFSFPVPGVAELCSAAVVVTVFLQAPDCLDEQGLVKTEIMEALMPHWMRWLVNVISEFFGAGLFGLITIALWKPMVQAAVRHEYIGPGSTLTVPLFPVYLVVICSSAVMTFIFARRLYRTIVPTKGAPNHDA